MNLANASNRKALGGVAALALVLGLTSAVVACSVTVFAGDATRDAYYFQFSLDQPISAYRYQVIERTSGTVVARRTVRLSPPTTGVSDEVHGLTPGTRYTFRMSIRCASTGAWMPGHGTRFRTNP